MKVETVDPKLKSGRHDDRSSVYPSQKSADMSFLLPCTIMENEHSALNCICICLGTDIEHTLSGNFIECSHKGFKHYDCRHS